MSCTTPFHSSAVPSGSAAFSWRALRDRLQQSIHHDPAIDDLTTQRGIVQAAVAIAGRMSDGFQAPWVPQRHWKPFVTRDEMESIARDHERRLQTRAEATRASSAQPPTDFPWRRQDRAHGLATHATTRWCSRHPHPTVNSTT